MESKEVSIIEFDGKEYVIVDIISNYTYIVNTEDKNDILVLKTKLVDGEEILEEVENNAEAMKLFYEKYKEVMSALEN